MSKSQGEKRETVTHPSFGIININRAQIGGGFKRLFDSPFKHHHIVTLQISAGQLTRSLHGDTTMPASGAPFISVAMSEVQFAEMVLNAGRFGGTPCTIEYLNGERMPEPPKADVKKLWADEVKAGFKDIAESASAAEKSVDELLGKDRITKADVKVLQEIIRTLAQDLHSNIPWMQERFQEAMEKTVADAKGEINAHLTNIVQKTGLAALQGKELPRLEISEGEEKP